jgi:hypothetical protein
MVKNILLIISGIFIISASASAQEISAHAYTDKTSYSIGDYINYVIEVDYSKGINVYTPDIKKNLSGVEILSEEPPQPGEKNNKKTVSFRYVLGKYDSANVNIPPVPVFYSFNKDTAKQAAITNGVSFAVHTLKVDTEGDIKDVKDPLRIPLPWQIILFWSLGALLLIGALLYYYLRVKKKKKKKIVKKIVYVPPHIKALTALHNLESRKLWQAGLIKEYHTRITEIIRRYFEERFKFLAMELTTYEIMEHMNRITIPENIKKITYAFLANADLVKFAKYIPLDSINEEMMRQAYEIVENTVPETIPVKTETEYVQ